jgi:hypothetical protein
MLFNNVQKGKRIATWFVCLVLAFQVWLGASQTENRFDSHQPAVTVVADGGGSYPPGHGGG